jgi:hypothetical protein
MQSPLCGILIFIVLSMICLALGYCLCKPILYGQSNPSPTPDLRCGHDVGPKPPQLSSDELRQRADQVFIASPQPQGGIANLPFSMGMAEPETASGAPFLSEAFEPSDQSAEFFETFGGVSNLASQMPANWRNTQDCPAVAPQAGSAVEQTAFDEFSRYTITPSALQKSEILRGTIRLAELSSTRNARTLGSQSLLRNAVTPLKPVPIGSSNFVFMDSDARLGYIAAAAGRYPKMDTC